MPDIIIVVMMSMSDVDVINSVERGQSTQAAAAPETVEMTVGEEGMTGLTEAVIVGVAENVAPHVVNTVGTMEGPVTATLLEDMTCLLPLSG